MTIHHHLFLYQDTPLSHPWFVLVNSEPNISRVYTPQLQSWVSLLHSTSMKMELLVSSETSALKAQTPGDYTKDARRHDYPSVITLSQAYIWVTILCISPLYVSTDISWRRKGRSIVIVFMCVTCAVRLFYNYLNSFKCVQHKTR